MSSFRLIRTWCRLQSNMLRIYFPSDFLKMATDSFICRLTLGPQGRWKITNYWKLRGQCWKRNDAWKTGWHGTKMIWTKALLTHLWRALDVKIRFENYIGLGAWTRTFERLLKDLSNQNMVTTLCFDDVFGIDRRLSSSRPLKFGSHSLPR